MTDTSGDDPDYDLDTAEKDQVERHLRKQARQRMAEGKHQERKRLLDRATEISRRKSRRAHRGTD